MTTSSSDSSSFSDPYLTLFWLVLVGAAVLGFLLAEGDAVEGSSSTTMEKPPMPTTEVELAENEVIEQDAVDLEASLDLTSRKTVSASPDE